MARSDSFQKKWASVPSQFERPTDALIDRGWAGGAAEDPPEAKWENWWHNRVDEALAEIESKGALQWFSDIPYSVHAEAVRGAYIWIAAKPSTGVEPGGAQDEGHWIRKSLTAPSVISISTSSQLTVAQMGSLVLADATAAITITLPLNDTALGVAEITLRRVDATSNSLVIAASGTDKLMLDTTAEAAGQATTELLFAGDFLRLRSDGAGKWWCVGQAQLPGSIASGLVAYTTAGSHTFTVPAVLRSGRRVARVIATGGGGGSNGNTGGTPPRGAGGGAGGTAIGRVDLTGVVSVPVTVAAGGQPNGGSGGTSSFGAHLSATGGAGAAAGGSAGGSGGGATGGEINIPGGDGSDSAMVGGSGDGGSSYWRGGQRSAQGVSTIMPSTHGAGAGSDETAGLAAGPGIVVIQW